MYEKRTIAGSFLQSLSGMGYAFTHSERGELGEKPDFFPNEIGVVCQNLQCGLKKGCTLLNFGYTWAV